MDTKEFDGKILWFETITHPPDKSARFFTHGWAKMTAGSSYVSVAGLDSPGAMSGWSITFLADDLANFKRNDEKKSFELRGEAIIPDYIYIASAPRG